MPEHTPRFFNSAQPAQNEVTIRFATPSDATTIYDFICALARYEQEPDAVQATPENLRTQMEIPHPPFECLIAEWNGNPIGFLLFYQTYSTWEGQPGLHSEDRFVLPEFRGQEIGTALFRRLATIALERGCTRIEGANLRWNHPAIRLNTYLGAQYLDEWTFWRISSEQISILATNQ